MIPTPFGVCSLHYKALQMFLIVVRHKPMKLAKNVDGFSPALWPKYRGDFKGGCPPLNGGWKGVQPLAAHTIWGFSDPAHAIWWTYFPCCKIRNRGCSWCQNAVG